MKLFNGINIFNNLLYRILIIYYPILYALQWFASALQTDFCGEICAWSVNNAFDRDFQICDSACQMHEITTCYEYYAID